MKHTQSYVVYQILAKSPSFRGRLFHFWLKSALHASSIFSFNNVNRELETPFKTGDDKKSKNTLPFAIARVWKLGGTRPQCLNLKTENLQALLRVSKSYLVAMDFNIRHFQILHISFNSDRLGDNCKVPAESTINSLQNNVKMYHKSQEKNAQRAKLPCCFLSSRLF